MKRLGSFFNAAIIGLSGIILLGIWFTRQSLQDETPRSMTPPISGNLEPYFYREIGTSGRSTQIASNEPPPLEQFTIELGVVRDRNQAENAVRRLGERGIEAFYTPLNRQGQVIYRIRTGVFPQEDLAVNEAKRLQGQYQLESRVISF